MRECTHALVLRGRWARAHYAGREYGPKLACGVEVEGLSEVANGGADRTCNEEPID